VTRQYRVKWERLGSEEFEGSRFAFMLEDLDEQSTNNDSFSVEL
jgi:hypothetical protein